MTEATAFENLAVERRANALWITLSRPKAFNALTPATIAELGVALDRVDADPSLRCVVLTGAGKAFCAGADLKAVLAAGRDGTAEAATMHFLREVGRVFD